MSIVAKGPERLLVLSLEAARVKANAELAPWREGLTAEILGAGQQLSVDSVVYARVEGAARSQELPKRDRPGSQL